MIHSDHVNLLRDGVTAGGVWADFGSGRGAFTLALADLLGASGHIHSVERDSGVLKQQQAALRAQFRDVPTTFYHADFTRQLDLPPLDGIVMANSLHFIRDKTPVLAMMRGYLKPDGRFILVEYDTDSGNTWVPYPLAYPTWEGLAAQHGFIETRRIGRYPSRFLHEIYSALSCV